MCWTTRGKKYIFTKITIISYQKLQQQQQYNGTKKKGKQKEVVMEIFLVALVVFDLKRGERKNLLCSQ